MQLSLQCLQAVRRMKEHPPVSAIAARHAGLRRAQDLIAHARAHSPFYRRLYADVPVGSPLTAYPSVSRNELMDAFNTWATDRRINKASVRQFLNSTDRIGHRYLEDYLVWTSSGTTGKPATFVQDRQALCIYQALLFVRYQQNGSAFGEPWNVAFDTRRLAMVAALEGHFAGVVFWHWASRINPWLASRSRTFSILQPLPNLVQALNDWQPGFLSSYPSVLLMLAAEQEQGRLRLSPDCLWCGGEGLTEQQRHYIEHVFSCRLVEDYGASEAMNMAFSCEYGRLHVNTDWFILEPIDERGQPVASGEASATMLVSNLANRVQPLIRFDIGDSVTLHSDPCECGNPLPVISVDGRSDDTLWLPARDGQNIPVLPLALNTVIEEAAGEFGFQLIQTAPDTLLVRTEGVDEIARSSAFANVCSALEYHFKSIGALAVKLQHDTIPPERDARSGKLRQVSCSDTATD